MKQGSTLFLKGVVLFLGAIVLALCIFALPAMWKEGSEEFPEASRAVFLIIISMYLTAAPFFFALWQALRLLRYIDKNIAFSDQSVKALRKIKYCAIIIAALYIMDEPLMFPIAEADDAPGAVIIWMGIALAPIVVAVFAAILERLLKNALDIKSENDLTV